MSERHAAAPASPEFHKNLKNVKGETLRDFGEFLMEITNGIFGENHDAKVVGVAFPFAMMIYESNVTVAEATKMLDAAIELFRQDPPPK